MADQSQINGTEKLRNNSRKSRLGIVSLIIALSAIPFFYTSIYRVKTLQDSHVCIFRETPLYGTVDSLCSVLPALSVTFGLLSLINCRRNKTRFTAAIPALAGIVLTLTSLGIYALTLLDLAYSY